MIKNNLKNDRLMWKISYVTKYFFLFFTFLIFSKYTIGQTKKYKDYFVVSQSDSGDFRTIQDAINAVRDLSQQKVTIFIKNGVYKEKVIIPSEKCNINLLGESKENTIITNDDYWGKIINNDSSSKITTFTSFTLLVGANNLIIKNLTIRNSSGPVGQAVALHVVGDKVEIIDCIIDGFQDTIYASMGRQFYKNCTIEGSTDFIFGRATAIFQNCMIISKSNSYITAPATDKKDNFGFVFFGCKFGAIDNKVNNVFLGRPWRPFGKCVFINCELGGHILPVGWDNWNDTTNENTAFFAEYNNVGKGAKITNRVKWSRQLTKKEFEKYTIKNIFASNNLWIPTNYNN